MNCRKIGSAFSARESRSAEMGTFASKKGAPCCALAGGRAKSGRRKSRRKRRGAMLRAGPTWLPAAAPASLRLNLRQACSQNEATPNLPIFSGRRNRAKCAAVQPGEGRANNGSSALTAASRLHTPQRRRTSAPPFITARGGARNVGFGRNAAAAAAAAAATAAHNAIACLERVLA